MTKTKPTNKAAKVSNCSVASIPEGNQEIKPKITKVKWTAEEDSILLSCIKENPSNLKIAFTNASILLVTRSEASCSSRWYGRVSNNTGKGSVAFICASKEVVGRNRKSLRKPVSSVVPNQQKSIWTKLWNRFASFFE